MVKIGLAIGLNKGFITTALTNKQIRRKPS